jgi:hypothetical protein
MKQAFTLDLKQRFIDNDLQQLAINIYGYPLSYFTNEATGLP